MNDKSKQHIYSTNANNSYSTLSVTDKRDFNTIFLDNKKKLELITYIDTWANNKELFSSRGINYKTGILLYGEPGTGKTSIAKAIAAKLNSSITIINMSIIESLNLDNILRKDPNVISVVVLEDIDCIIGKRKEDKLTEKERNAFNITLQLLDGINSVSNTIFIATTNHFEQLDPALIRDGRFDVKMEIGKLNKELSIEMCKSFDVDPDMILNSEEEFINPSELQNKIIKYCLKANI